MITNMIAAQQCREEFQKQQSRIIEDWKKFLSFPSISADPAFDMSCRNCAGWLKQQFSDLGFESRLAETSGKPLVLAHRPGKKDSKRVLFYGHYDVQPVDPLDLWKSDPFKPELREGRLYARGAEDNKGQVWFFVEALRFLISRNLLECPVSIIIEGEEESSGAGVKDAIPALRSELQSDVLMVCDTGMERTGIPSVTMGLRGVIGIEVRLSGPTHDLHSGTHGGVVKNPAVELARLIASLHDKDGRIAIKGYYDGTDSYSEEDRRLSQAVSFDEEEFVKTVGVLPTGGEAGRPMRERRGMRPTLEVNGVISGYTGTGMKTIIPAQASVKISSRIVVGQDPERCLDLIEQHLREKAPNELKFEVVMRGSGGGALSLKADSRLVGVARDVLSQVGPGQVDFAWEGASIPIVSALANVSGAEPLLVGFGSEEDRIHAPNESFSLKQFEMGFCYAALMLHRIGCLG